jgi:hypothetical protein
VDTLMSCRSLRASILSLSFYVNKYLVFSQRFIVCVIALTFKSSTAKRDFRDSAKNGNCCGLGQLANVRMRMTVLPIAAANRSIYTPTAAP